VLALIVSGKGFPFGYATSDGNRADVSSLEVVVRMVKGKYGKARRVWVFDRSIVSEKNLQILRKPEGQRLAGTPRSQLKQLERELLAADWKQARDDVEVRLVPAPSGAETYLLSRSAARKEKDVASKKLRKADAQAQISREMPVMP
jgi:hypothetical protein